MKRSLLDEYIGKNICVVFTDNRKESGMLEYVDKFCEAQHYRKPGYFYIGHYGFKCSHVKKVELL